MPTHCWIACTFSKCPSAGDEDAHSGDRPVSTAAMLEANTLQKDGSQPFHLKMSFETFDLEGKPAENGTLEYWWAGPSGFLLDITTPSIGTVHNVRLNEVPVGTAKRSLYLTDELLNAFRSPASVIGKVKGPLPIEKRVAGQVVLECLHPENGAGPIKDTAVCTDDQSGTIRLISSPAHTVFRNQVGTFAGTHVAMDLTVVLGGTKAIHGHVDTLQAFNPTDTTVALVKPETNPGASTSTPKYVRLAGSVISGAKIGGAQPSYPELARREHVQGTVIMLAEISAEGLVANVTPLSSPDARLTDAAVDAVKTWKFRPYSFNGTPVAVSTTLTVNFNLSH